MGGAEGGRGAWVLGEASQGPVKLKPLHSVHPTLQDPVIFSGTIRSNLDPFATAGSDSHIWEALKRAGMEGFVAAMQGAVPALPRPGMNNDHAVTVTHNSMIDNNNVSIYSAKLL